MSDASLAAAMVIDLQRYAFFQRAGIAARGCLMMVSSTIADSWCESDRCVASSILLNDGYHPYLMRQTGVSRL